MEALAVNIKGKCDKNVQTMALWDDKECPELCPSHNLMVWMSVSGIKSSYLFLKRSYLNSIHYQDGEPATEHATYTTLLDHIRNLVMNTIEIQRV